MGDISGARETKHVLLTETPKGNRVLFILRKYIMSIIQRPHRKPTFQLHKGSKGSIIQQQAHLYIRAEQNHMIVIGRITSARVYVPHDNVRGETLLVSTCFNHLPLSCHFVAMRTPWMGLVILLVFAPRSTA